MNAENKMTINTLKKNLFDGYGSRRNVSIGMSKFDEIRELVESEGFELKFSAETDGARSCYLVIALEHNENILYITAGNGVKFGVRMVYDGDSYGLASFGSIRPNYLVNRGETLVEFYDTRYMHTCYGQFTGGRYHAKDMVFDESGQEIKHGGLTLDGAVPAWSLDENTMSNVRAWIHERLEVIEVSKTYETYTEESRENGESDTNGYVFKDVRMTLEEAFQEIEKGTWELSDSDVSYLKARGDEVYKDVRLPWLSEVDYEGDTRHSLHFSKVSGNALYELLVRAYEAGHIAGKL